MVSLYRCDCWLFSIFQWEYNRVLEPDFESCHRYDIIFNCILCISKRTEYPSDRIYQRFCFHPYGSVPSIHVYNSVAAFSAIHTCKNLQKHKGIRTGSFILTTLIVLSTMFLKQHSIADVATGITCAVATYVLFYSRAAEKQGAKAKQRSPLHQHDTHM